MSNIKEILNSKEFKAWLVDYESASSAYWLHLWYGEWLCALFVRFAVWRINRKLRRLDKYYANRRKYFEYMDRFVKDLPK